MSVEAMLDTNILLYALSKAPEDRLKSEASRELMRTVEFGTSLQILQEFYHAARRKARLKITESMAERVVGELLLRPFQVTTPTVFARARELCSETGVAYWDAAILAATEAMGAPILYSEDLSAGQVYGSVRVLNPFQ